MIFTRYSSGLGVGRVTLVGMRVDGSSMKVFGIRIACILGLGRVAIGVESSFLAYDRVSVGFLCISILLKTWTTRSVVVEGLIDRVAEAFR